MPHALNFLMQVLSLRGLSTLILKELDNKKFLIFELRYELLTRSGAKEKESHHIGSDFIKQHSCENVYLTESH